MTNAHYQKYKETIKRVARKNYRKRVKWLNDFLADKYCVHCKESETVVLKFYPHDTAIRRQVKRVGMNDESHTEVRKLIEQSKIVYHQLVSYFLTTGFHFVPYSSTAVPTFSSSKPFTTNPKGAISCSI